MPSNLEAVSMIADIGQQQWLCTNFRLSDRTKGAKIGFWSFHRNWGKYARPPIILTLFSLGVCMREGQHIYEDLNGSSSASPGGSHQLEIPPSLNSKRATNFFQIRWYFTRRGDFNPRPDSIVRLYFWQAPSFCKSAYISGKRQHFVNPPIFLESANIV